MAENKLLTRISLKYDTLANWSDTTKEGKGANLILNKGEVGFCEIPTGSTEATTAPTVLFKVGDGTHKFSELKWASALAADVYAWAKKTEDEFKAWAKSLVPIEVIDTPANGKFITKVEATSDANGHHITITRGNVDWNDVNSKPNLVNSVKTTDDDVVVLTPETAASGDVTITGAHAKKGPSAGYTGSTNIKGGTAVVGTELDIKVPVLTVDAYGHTNAVNEASYKITIPKATAPNDGELTLKAGNGLTATEKVFTANDPNNVTFEVSHANTSDAANLVANGRKYVTGLTFDDYGHVTGYTTGTEADQDLSNYKTLQTAVSDPTASGKSLTFIDTISQNANGVISATKKNVNLDDYLKTADETAITITDKADTDTNDLVYAVSNLEEGGTKGHAITATYKAVVTKAYVDKMVAGAVDYLGTASSASDLSTTAGKGDFYRASAKFTLGTEEVHVGDMLIALSDKPTQDLSGWDVAHLEVDTDTWAENSVSADGYVKKGEGQVYKVWATDKDGNPDWRWLDAGHLDDSAVKSHEQNVVGDGHETDGPNKYVDVTHPTSAENQPIYTKIALTQYAEEAIDEAFNTLAISEYTAGNDGYHTVDVNFKQKDGTIREVIEFVDGDYIKITTSSNSSEIVVDVQDSVKTSLEKADKSLNAENLHINDDCVPEDNFWGIGLYNDDGGDYIGMFGFTTEDGIEVRQETAHDCKIGLSETVKTSLGKADTAIQEGKLTESIGELYLTGAEISDNQAYVDLNYDKLTGKCVSEFILETKDGIDLEVKKSGVEPRFSFGLSTATQASLAKADSALQEVEAGYGITVTEKANGKQTVSLDTVSVLIIDCGSSMDVI